MHSGDLYHAVDKWKPAATMEKDKITPGRVGMVYFSPDTALSALEDKAPGWMRDTCGGDTPTLDRKFSQTRKRRRDDEEECDSEEKEYRKARRKRAGTKPMVNRTASMNNGIVRSESDGSIRLSDEGE